MRALTFLLIVAVGGLVLSPRSADATVVHLWSHGFGNTNPDGGLSMGADAAGNVVVTGVFSNTVDFGGGPVTAATPSMFLAEYDPAGIYQWSRSFSATCTNIAVDASGNTVAVGYCVSPIDFGGGSLAAIGLSDLFVAKFDASGAHVWSARYGATNGEVYDPAVALDGSGNVVVVGTFTDGIDPGGGLLTSAGGRDLFVAKYNMTGAYQWSERFGDTSVDLGLGIAASASGNVVVSGLSATGLDFGGGALNPGGFVAGLDAAGVPQWGRGGGERVSAVAVDGDDNVLATGRFTGTTDFGGGPLTSAGSIDAFLVKYDAGGTHQWSKRLGGTGADWGRDVAVDVSDHVAVTGQFAETVDFGGGALTSAGGSDIFVADYDADGVHRWSRAFGSNSTVTETGNGVACDPSGNVLVTGQFGGTVDFGGGPLTSAGLDDIFIASFGETQPLAVAFTGFSATARGAAVRVDWSLWSDESMQRFTLYRRAEGASLADIVARGDPRTIHTYTDTSVEPGKTYVFEMEIETADGSVYQSPPATVTVGTMATAIGPNYPNPFNPQTTIEYTIDARMPIAIEIVDVTGAIVARLDQGVRDAGTHHAVWNGRDVAGRPVGSGVYFYRLSGRAAAGAGKMVLLK